MLSDEVIEKVVQRLLQRTEKANIYFLKQLGSKIKKIKKLSPSDAHKLVQILKYGGEYNDIVKQISKYTDLNVKEIDKIFKEFSIKDHSFDKQFYQYRNVPYIPYEQNEVLKRQTEALANIVKKEMYNYTRNNVLGYTITDLKGNIKFKGLRQIYNEVLDEALLNVSQGKETFDSSMSRILKDIGSSGLKTLEYESGRAIRLDSAIRMHLKGRLRELHNENQELFGKEFGADGVEITVHSNPAPDHAPVQGRQFSTVRPSKKELSEWEKLQEGKEAIDYKGNSYTLDHDGKNGYRPISEMNCYHYTFAIVLGISEPEYTDKELKQIINDNSKGFDFDGKHYTMYEGTQLQRSLERKIREEKDTQILGKESGNELVVYDSQQKITQLTRKYNELSKASGLPTKANRLKVNDYKRIKLNNLFKGGSNNFTDFTLKKPDNIKFIEKIDINDRKLIDDKLIEYGNKIKNSKIEHGFFVDKNGYVFEVKGNENKFTLPKWFDTEDAIGIHNHPPKSTNYSFSYDDIDLFLRGKMKEFYGFDYKYEYILKDNKKPYIKDGIEIKRHWKEIEDYLEELNMFNKLKYEIDEIRYHYINKEMQKIYKYTYIQKKNLHFK